MAPLDLTDFPPVLKFLRDEITTPLTILFQKSLDDGMIPDEWRDANVTVIHKKGSRAEPGNYRGVSLTSVLGKLHERMVKNEIDSHIENNNLMKDSQHGFRRRDETFRTMNGLNREDKDNWFRFRNPENVRATRSTVSVTENKQIERKDVLFMEHVRVDSRKYFFSVRVTSEWNKIPDEIKAHKSVKAFKNRYDEWMRIKMGRQQRT